MLFPPVTPLHQLQSDVSCHMVEEKVPSMFLDSSRIGTTTLAHPFRSEPLFLLDIHVLAISSMSLFQSIIPAVVARPFQDISPSIHSTVLLAQEQPSQLGTLVPVTSMSFRFGSTRRHIPQCLPLHSTSLQPIRLERPTLVQQSWRCLEP